MFRTARVTSIEKLLICYKEILALPEKKNALTWVDMIFTF